MKWELLQRFASDLNTGQCAHPFQRILHTTGNKKQVCQQEKDQLHRVQVEAMERRGQMLRKEMAVETVNEWLLETLR